jgi:hypothetical protein
LPTYETTERFRYEHSRLTAEQGSAFRRAVERFVSDLEHGQFRAGLRVKGIAGMPGCFEMSWAMAGPSSAMGRKRVLASRT